MKRIFLSLILSLPILFSNCSTTKQQPLQGTVEFVRVVGTEYVDRNMTDQYGNTHMAKVKAWILDVERNGHVMYQIILYSHINNLDSLGDRLPVVITIRK